MNIEDLKKPLSIDDIDFRVQSINNGGYATILAYKNARVDMNRLDEVVGALNWKREHLNSNANCIVSIWCTEKKEWVSKEDRGTESMADKEKGLASDSFKRACFNWGIGRELYDYPVMLIKLNADEYAVSNDKVKQTWNLKLKEWKWDVIFENNILKSLKATDQNNKLRWEYSDNKKIEVKKEAKLIELTKENTKIWNNCLKALMEGTTIDEIKLKVSMTKDIQEQLLSEAI